MPQQKNKPVGGHRVDLLLDCGHVKSEAIEAAVYLPREGEERTCATCHKVRNISKVGSMYWIDKEE